MELKINSWGIVFETGWVDLYIQKTAVVTAAVVVAGFMLYRLYKNRDQK